jgi:AcrR family transcriptional regulator
VHDRDDILDAARRVLNVDASTSMGDLAAAIGIGRATLHRHFSTREALLHEIGSRSLDRWAATQAALDLAGTTRRASAEQTAACLRAMLEAMVSVREDFDFALTDPTVLAMPDLVDRSDALQAVEVAFLAAAQERGVVRRDLPAAWLSHTVYGLMVAAREALRAGDVAARPLPDLLVTTFLEGAAPR